MVSAQPWRARRDRLSYKPGGFDSELPCEAADPLHRTLVQAWNVPAGPSHLGSDAWRPCWKALFGSLAAGCLIDLAAQAGSWLAGPRGAHGPTLFIIAAWVV